MPSVTETIEINAPAKKCYEVITDYEAYPEFLDNLKKVSVAKKKGESCEITYEIDLIKTITYTLKMHGKPPKRVEWSFVKGDIMKDNHGHWELEEIRKGVTKATYELNIELGLLVPGVITKKLVGKNLPEMLKNFKKRIESSK
jgi:ribosome-associated toxin RatA of RatAB toxin-antitoxin module